MNTKEPTGTCPMCKAKTDRAFRPFCSRRCAELDLARWLNGSYAIPGPPAAAHDVNQELDDDGAGPVSDLDG